MLLNSIIALAQKPSKIEIINADILDYDKAKYGNLTRLVGNCAFKQDNVLLYCDSAMLDETRNSFDAYSRVKIIQGDSLTITADLLKYDGNEKKARLFDNITMVDKDIVLTTNNLEYNTKTRVGTYYNGGKLTNKENVLTSRNGYYYANSRDSYFRYNVVLTSPESTMKSDTLRYNTGTRIAYFYGPTTILSKDGDKLYTENGNYNTLTGKANFYKKSTYQTGNQILRGDTLFYDRKQGFGKGYSNVSVEDIAEKVTIFGQYAQSNRVNNVSYVTKKAFAVLVSDSDSLYLAADTLKTKLDTNGKDRMLLAYHTVKIFKSDLQAVCDSMAFAFKDSIMRCYKDPVIWAQGSQLSADFITLQLKNKKLDKINMYNAAFIISPDDSINYFNQVKGKNMYGTFLEGKLERLLVEGNGQSIYFAKEENGKYIGVNSAECSNILVKFKENKTDRITFITKPDATFSPLNQIDVSELKLKNFNYQETLRPKSKEEALIR